MARRRKQDLAELLDEACVSIAALARKAGVSRPYLYEVMRGASEPSDEYVEKLLLALAVEIDLKILRSAIAESQRRGRRMRKG